MMGNEDLANDLLDGVSAIAAFTGLSKRQVYDLAERGLLPLFKMGDRKWQGRKSTLREHVAKVEAHHIAKAEAKRAAELEGMSPRKRDGAAV
jgi:hypothetical protein